MTIMAIISVTTGIASIAVLIAWKLSGQVQESHPVLAEEILGYTAQTALVVTLIVMTGCLFSLSIPYGLLMVAGEVLAVPILLKWEEHRFWRDYGKDGQPPF